MNSFQINTQNKKIIIDVNYKLKKIKIVTAESGLELPTKVSIYIKSNVDFHKRLLELHHKRHDLERKLINFNIEILLQFQNAKAQ